MTTDREPPIETKEQREAEAERALQLEQLRERAEEVLRAKAHPVTGRIDPHQALEDLHVYRAELELQNDELRSTQRDLELSRRRYYELFDLAPVGYFQLDRAGMILQANLTGSLMLQRERRTLVRRRLSGFVAESDRAALHRHLEQVFDSDQRHSTEMRVRRGDGEIFDAHVESVAPLGRDGGPRQCLMALIDVSDQRRAERRLELLMSELRAANAQLSEMAHLDPLTGLLNRRGLEHVLASEVGRARRLGNEPFALLADCDDFKRINDAMGHAVGDTVLREVAERLRESLRPTDQIARVGGDEFLVLLPDTSQATGMRVAERMRLAVSSTPVLHNPHPVTVTISVGAVSVPHETMSIEEILSRAHSPLKKSKTDGKDTLSTDELPAVTPELLAERAFASFLDFEGAVSSEHGLGLYVLGQPIRSVADQSVVGVELLSRAKLPGFEAPENLFRLAMQHGVLTTLDLACLKRCIASIEQMPSDLEYHVNLFPSTILNTPAERLLELFDGIDLSRVCLEVSEQQLIGDPTALREPLVQLTDAGLNLAMDDIGFGRSSLETLIVLEPDLAKIDRRVVTGASHDAGRRRSLTRLLRLLDSLDVKVVAEGVESVEDLDLLGDLGVAAGQGYYLGRPSEALATGSPA
jgi:diguanylate cyclase (GGDEF)-like protein/PAS domain S-box-containing protein